MKPSFSLLFILICWFEPIQARHAPKKTKPLKSTSGWDPFLERVFDEADQNNDGSISFQETYERVLLFYIHLNRQAPIPPPSKETVLSLYSQADWSHNRKLNKDEFKALARTLAARGYTRLFAHKFVSIVIAPIVANYVVDFLANSPACASLRRGYSVFVVDHIKPEKLVEMLLSIQFWKTLTTILAVMQLGNLVLFFINRWFYNTKSIIIETEKSKHK